ncbi:MAG: serine hydrolase [Eubacteriaceae bacterium]|nr:serine hydrolase [Eubacteriaceae bacterium]
MSKKENNKSQKKVLCILIAAALVFTAFPITGNAADPDVQTITAASGIAMSPCASAKTTLKDNIKIMPAAGRDIELQMYNSSAKEFTTQATFKADSNNNVTLVYPSVRSKKTYSKWRIHVAATEEAAEYTGPIITVTTRNIKSVSLSSRTACIYCVNTKETIYGKYMNTRKPQASTTKIMTALIVMDQNKLSQKARVSNAAAHTAWRNLYMKPGDRYYVRDMIHALLLPSSNDAANVLAEKNAGSKKAFIKKMNARAKAMGLTRTHYKNAHGLDASGHYTTAYDLARLTAAAYKYKTFRTVIKKKKYSFKSLRYKKKKTVRTTDKLLGYTSAFKGGKTGYDNRAGYCFSAVYVYKGRTYIVSTLGSNSSKGRWNDSKKLYKYLKTYGRSSW